MNKQQLKENLYVELTHNPSKFWAKKFDTVACLIIPDKYQTVCGSYKALLGNNYAENQDRVCPACIKALSTEKTIQDHLTCAIELLHDTQLDPVRLNLYLKQLSKIHDGLDY